MRRDALDRAVKQIHWKVPKYLYARCMECEDDVKGEQMWWWWRHGGGLHGTARIKQWTCRRCAPRMSDLFRLNPEFFKGVDYSILVEEENQLTEYNRQGSSWAGQQDLPKSAGPP